jgi:hypothetical protein
MDEKIYGTVVFDSRLLETKVLSGQSRKFLSECVVTVFALKIGKTRLAFCV